jgi:formamidopyrimidine-DNA glycosylase
VPEGDTVHLAAERLARALRGRTLTGTDFRTPRLATTDLSGHAVLEVVARGKHLLFRLDRGLTLHTHFRMEGTWHLYKAGEPWRGPAHEVRAVLQTSEWAAVAFRIPTIDVIRSFDEDAIVGHLGPDVLGLDWDPDEVVRRMCAQPDRPIADVLLDQRVLAGVGNVYKCEICFLRGVHPSAAVREAGDLHAMVGLIKRTMEANRYTGTHRTTGDARRGREHWVYGRAGQPCYRCGTRISRRGPEPDTGRVTFWCAACQPLPG